MRTSLQMHARSASESRYPQLWNGCVCALAPCLGPTGATTLRDWSGRGLHATVTGTLSTYWAVSGGQYANVLNGTTDYAEIASTSLLNNSVQSTSFWLSLNNPGSGITECIAANVPPAETSGWIIQTSLSGGVTRFQTRKYTPHAQADLSSGFLFTSGQWYHVVISWDGTNARLYVDGTLRDTFALVSPTGGAAIARIGADSRGAAFAFLGGKLDDFRIYNRLLNASEISLLYSGGLGRGIAYAIRERRRVISASGGMLLQRRRKCA